jgi:hypothetical protein
VVQLIRGFESPQLPRLDGTYKDVAFDEPCI